MSFRVERLRSIMKKIVTLPKFSNEILAAFFSFQNEVLSYQECEKLRSEHTVCFIMLWLVMIIPGVTEITSKWYVKV